MKQVTAQWIEAKVSYEKTMEDGKLKNVSEKYVVDALSFTEAEAAVTEEMLHYVSGDFSVKAVQTAPYGEIFFSEDEKDDTWYKTKVKFITMDEKTGKERKSYANYLVQASSIGSALESVDKVFAEAWFDYVVERIEETKILDVFCHKDKVKSDEAPEKFYGANANGHRIHGGLSI